MADSTHHHLPGIRHFIAALALLVVGVASAAAQEPISDSDRMAIRDVITAQLDAFRVDDADRAFSFAAPDVQRMAGSPEAFLAMVRRDYYPVYRPRAVFFQDVTLMNGVPAQRVLVMDESGAPVQAVYPMQRQRDGSWRIAGCMLYQGNANML